MVEGYSQGCKLRSCLACVSMVRVDSSSQKKLLGEETQRVEVGSHVHGAIARLTATGLQLARAILL